MAVTPGQLVDPAAADLHVRVYFERHVELYLKRHIRLYTDSKVRNDRIVPLHPQLVELLATWTATNLDHIRSHRRLVVDHRGPVDRQQVWRIVRRVARAAG